MRIWHGSPRRVAVSADLTDTLNAALCAGARDATRCDNLQCHTLRSAGKRATCRSTATFSSRGPPHNVLAPRDSRPWKIFTGAVSNRSRTPRRNGDFAGREPGQNLVIRIWVCGTPRTPLSRGSFPGGRSDWRLLLARVHTVFPQGACPFGFRPRTRVSRRKVIRRLGASICARKLLTLKPPNPQAPKTSAPNCTCTLRRGFCLISTNGFISTCGTNLYASRGDLWGSQGIGVISNNWFYCFTRLDSLHVQTLMLTDVQTPFHGTPLVPLKMGALWGADELLPAHSLGKKRAPTEILRP